MDPRMDPALALLGGPLSMKPKKKPCCKGTKNQPWTDGALMTEYQKEYWEKRGKPERAQCMYPKSNHGPAGAFEGATTYGTTYKVPEGSGPALPFKPNSGERENLPFSPWTTYKVDFPAKEVPYARVRPQNALAASAGAFDDATTMKTDYPGWVQKPATPVRHVSQPRSMGPFEGTSMYKDDFRKWEAARRVPAGPVLSTNSAMPRGPFDDATTSRTAYTAKHTDPVTKYRPEDNGIMPEGWYDGTPSTEYRRHYTEKDGRAPPRAAATTGPSGAVLPKGGFSGDTTYGGDFRPRTTPGFHRAAKPADEAVQSGPFMGATTYGDSYIKKDVPYARVKPTNAFQPNESKFDDATEMKTNYQNWGPREVVRQARPRVAAAEVGPFDGATTYKTDFIKMQGLRAQTAGRPMSGTRGLREQGPFDGTTTYTVDFVPKAFDPVRSYRPGCDHDCDDDPNCVDD